jgi:hypothetical protein
MDYSYMFFIFHKYLMGFNSKRVGQGARESL